MENQIRHLTNRKNRVAACPRSRKRGAANVAGAGNVLNVAENKAIAGKAAIQADDFAREVNREGVISDTINEHAKEYKEAKGKERDKVKRKVLAEIKKRLAEG